MESIDLRPGEDTRSPEFLRRISGREKLPLMTVPTIRYGALLAAAAAARASALGGGGWRREGN